MSERSLLSGLDQALNQGWTIKGDCHPDFEAVRRVSLFPPTKDTTIIVGYGCTIEQALYAADRSFCNPNYEALRPEDLVIHTEPALSPCLDRWVYIGELFEGREEDDEVVVEILLNPDDDFCHDGKGKSLVEAFNQAFPGEGEIIAECVANCIGREIFPDSVPLILNPQQRRIILCSEA